MAAESTPRPHVYPAHRLDVDGRMGQIGVQGNLSGFLRAKVKGTIRCIYQLTKKAKL